MCCALLMSIRPASRFAMNVLAVVFLDDAEFFDAGTVACGNCQRDARRPG